MSRLYQNLDAVSHHIFQVLSAYQSQSGAALACSGSRVAQDATRRLFEAAFGTPERRRWASEVSFQPSADPIYCSIIREPRGPILRVTYAYDIRSDTYVLRCAVEVSSWPQRWLAAQGRAV